MDVTIMTKTSGIKLDENKRYWGRQGPFTPQRTISYGVGAVREGVKPWARINTIAYSIMSECARLVEGSLLQLSETPPLVIFLRSK